MLGIFFYSYVAIGFGLLLPAIRVQNFLNIGARFTAGYAMLTIYVYVIHVLGRLPLGLTVLSAVMFGTVGFGLALYREKLRHFPAILIHPAILLSGMGVISVLFNGGIDYIPFTIDEFTNWLGISREIHLHGGYEAIRKTVHLPGYTPGWRLLLLLPWQIGGEIEEGLSAAAPFVLHIAVVALIFDIAVFLMRTQGQIKNALAVFLAWIFLLLFLGVEGMGKLWSYTLLVEQPQIYSMVAVLLFIYLSGKITDSENSSRRHAYIYLGLVLAGSYLLKIAAALFIPVIFLFAVVPQISYPFFAESIWRYRLQFCFLTLAPILLMVISWSILNPSTSGLSSPFMTLQLLVNGNFNYSNQEIFNFSDRYFSAIWEYLSGYKIFISIVAAVGVVLILIKRREGALIVWVGWFVLYVLALFWSHLTIFGDYYFQHLNSIQRFLRIPVQLFHTLGLLLLLEYSISILKNQNLIHAMQYLKNTATLVVGGFIILALGSWQIRQVHHSVADTTTRIYQNMDTRILEMKQANEFIKSIQGTKIPTIPNLVILSQPLGHASRAYAKYFARSVNAEGKVYSRFRVNIISSWPNDPQIDYRNLAKIAEFKSKLRSADVIWPIRVDTTLVSMLAELGVSTNCLSFIQENVIVANTNEGKRHFICQKKFAPKD